MNPGLEGVPRMLALSIVARRQGDAPFRAHQDHLSWVARGGYQHHVGPRALDVREGDFVWIPAGQVQRFVGASTCRGVTVMFDRALVEAFIPGHARTLVAAGQVVWHPEPRADDSLQTMLTLLATTLASRTPPAVVIHILAALLVHIASGAAVGDGTGLVFDSFRDQVERDFRVRHDVQHYARMLSYSPRTLTRACQAATGLGAKEFIDRRLVIEAKRLLVGSETPVLAIGKSLGFNDSSNFVRFFARHAGSSPRAYRRVILDNACRTTGAHPTPHLPGHPPARRN